MTRSLLCVILGSAALACAADPIVLKFKETEALFANPGQGWLCGPGSQATRFPCSVVYFRLEWQDVEPEEGKYQWDFIDSRIAAAKARGATVAFRVMTANAHSKGFYCSPKWLFDAGCKGYESAAGGDGASGGAPRPRIEPDYGDPLYLSKHAAFIRELGRRYDGHPDVEFLDIGSYGIWGEWHTPHPVSWEVRKQILDMYLGAFRKTPLMTMSDDAQAMAYTLPKGTGYRRDGVGSPWHEQNWIGSAKYKNVPGFEEAWKRAPAVFEWYGDYAYLGSKGWSFGAAIDFLLKNHVSFLNDNIGKVPQEAMPKLEELTRRIGYRFVLREMSYPGEVRWGESLVVRMQWSNVGVGKLYREYPLELYLLDKAGRVVAKVRSKADVRRWLPGDWTLTESLEVPQGLAAGSYTVGMALVGADGKGAIRLGMDAPEVGRVYRLGAVVVQ